MGRYIEHIKGKPAHIRRNIAFFVALALSLVIVAVWLSAGSAFEPRAAEKQRADTPSPFEELSGLFGDLWDRGSGELREFRTQFGGGDTR